MNKLIKKIIPVVLVLTMLFVALPNKAYADYTIYAMPQPSSITSSVGVLSNIGVLDVYMPYVITTTAPTKDYYFKLTCIEDGTYKFYGYTGTSGTRVAVENIPITITGQTVAQVPAGVVVSVMFTQVVVGKHYSLEIVETDDGLATYTTYAASWAQPVEITFAPGGGVAYDDAPYWKPAYDMIYTLGLNNSPETYVFEEGAALPIQIMQALKDNPDVTLIFKYSYEGTAYEVSIPGKEAIVDNEIPWYGPLWLAGHYGNAEKASVNGTYEVVGGDTLGQIAKKYNTTVDALLKLNPNITDKDKIYIGQIIKY